MKKLNQTIRGLILLALTASIFVQCSKGDDGGTSEPTTKEPEKIVITATDFTSSLDENPSQGQAIGSVQASANRGTLSFSLVSQSVAGAISINSSSGAISVADPALFDFETHQQITAKVRISVGDTTKEIDVTITIKDVTEVDVSSLTLWKGDTITFSKADGAEPSEESNQDRITEKVWLTRGKSGILYNIVSEGSANNDSSPAGTEWAQGTFDDLETLEFTNFRAACPGAKPKNAVNTPMVLHLIEDDVYIEITITSWTTNKAGGVTYRRSTE